MNEEMTEEEGSEYERHETLDGQTRESDPEFAFCYGYKSSHQEEF